MSTVRKISINEIVEDVNNTLLVAVVIATQKARFFASKRQENEMNGVWNCTIRDSPVDYINLTFWADEDKIRKMDAEVRPGDVIEVENSRAHLRSNNNNLNDDLYRPSVTSPYCLVLSETENGGSINKHSSEVGHCSLCTRLRKLRHLPTKPISGFRTLRDVQQIPRSLVNGDVVDLLVAVKSLSPIKVFKSKANVAMRKRELIVFDQTFPKLNLTIWDGELLERSEAWKPRETVLFLADVKIGWSDYHKCYCGSFTTKTITTENPKEFPEVVRLRKFASTAPLDVTEFVSQLTIEQINATTNVLSVNSLIEKINSFSNDKLQEFSATLYAHLTNFDLDGYRSIVTLKCGGCKSVISPDEKICLNLKCDMGSGSEENNLTGSYDLRIDLSDHTGTIGWLRITSECLNKLLGVGPLEFLELGDTEKARLKWKYLSERCRVKVHVYPAMDLSKDPVVTVVDCELADLNEAVLLIPQY